MLRIHTYIFFCAQIYVYQYHQIVLTIQLCELNFVVNFHFSMDVCMSAEGEERMTVLSEGIAVMISSKFPLFRYFRFYLHQETNFEFRNFIMLAQPFHILCPYGFFFTSSILYVCLISQIFTLLISLRTPNLLLGTISCNSILLLL